MADRMVEQMELRWVVLTAPSSVALMAVQLDCWRAGPMDSQKAARTAQSLAVKSAGSTEPHWVATSGHWLDCLKAASSAKCLVGHLAAQRVH